MKRICKYCGAGYDGDPGSTACPECVKRLRSSTIRERICRGCGGAFPGGPRAWYCPECRANRKRSADRRYKKSGPSRKLGSTDICQVCGKTYVVTSGLQRYCPECAPRAVREIDRQQSRAWAMEHLPPEQRRAERQVCTASLQCEVCGKSFPPKGRSKTCSAECRAVRIRQNAQAWECGHRDQRNRAKREARARETEGRRTSSKED